MIPNQLDNTLWDDSSDNEEDPLEITQKQRQLNPNLQPISTGSNGLHPSPSLRRKPPPFEEPQLSPPKTTTSKFKHSFRKSFIQEDRPVSPHSYSVPVSSTTSFNTDATPFWKYHILKFGKDLYLTTNPDLKHMYCRNAPGYYVVVTHTSDKGYTLVFKQQEVEVMTIIKHPHGFFEFQVPKNKYVNSEGIIENNQDVRIFQGFSYPNSIKSEYFPFENIREKYSGKFFKNFEVCDMKNNKWNIGSIPRVRISKINKLKTKVKNITEEISKEDNEENEFKLIGKRNIYFHRNYFTTNPTIYLHDQQFPPVLTIFRPYETKSVKRIKQSVSKKRQSLIHNSNRYSSDLGLKYYQSSDNTNQDDNPDENKLGWITVYDEEVLKNRGMFEFVVGMTLAVGFDSLSNLNDTIPWTEHIQFSQTNRTNTLILARRKSFALRCLPIYLPNSLIGSLFYDPANKGNITNLHSIPLIASNIHTSWIEMNYKFDMIYHVPILTTPGIDSKRYQFGMFTQDKNNNWDEYIDIAESYDYKYDSRIILRKIIDRTLTQINLLLHTTILINKKLDMTNNLGRLFGKFVMLSKVMKHETFDMIVVKIDKISSNNTASIKEQNDSQTYVELPAQAYLASVSNRPALAAINGLISSFPMFKIFTSNAVPVLVARQQSKRKNEAQKDLESQV
ncbi:hypothetical protein JA1_002786 [Spathaspora sp. JA1]|nr:hypothetical protein JA1_002786 [Spathaspora sp. JA1]